MMGGDAFSPTPRQMDLLRFIAGYAEAHRGLMPTLDEMARGCGLGGKSGAKRLVDQLVERGPLVRRAQHARAIALVVRPSIPRAPDGAPLYFVGAQTGGHASHHNGGIGQDHA